MMQVFVKTITGKTIVVDAEPSDSVMDVKSKVHCETVIPSDDQRLIFANKQLDNCCTLANCGHCADSTLHLLLQLQGGAKKRKKKTYNTPKKTKHEKEAVELPVLEVDGDGNLRRLRKECPSPGCGPGTFMASHDDRHHCCKCGLTMSSMNKVGERYSPLL